MAFLGIRQLDDAPILILSFGGNISAEDVRKSTEATPAFFQKIRQNAAMIIDTTGGTSEFGEILNMLKLLAQNASRRDLPFEIHTLCVGTDTMARLYVDASRLKQFGGTPMPLFATLDDAIAAARMMLASPKTEPAP